MTRVELLHLNGQKEELIWFKGTINGQPALILLDSGASRNFIDERFVEHHDLTTRTAPTLTVELADGTKKDTAQQVETSTIDLQGYRSQKDQLHVLALQWYDAILRKPWLYYHNPAID